MGLSCSHSNHFQMFWRINSKTVLKKKKLLKNELLESEERINPSHSNNSLKDKVKATYCLACKRSTLGAQLPMAILS